MKRTVLAALLALLILAGCKEDEEEIPGNYKITGYKVNGSDSLPQIGDLHLEGRLTLVPVNDNGSPNAITYNLETVTNDTTYTFGGSWNVDKESIAFFPRTFLKYSVSRGFQVHNSFTTNDTGPYPVLFPLAGRWAIKKQGEDYLDLQKDTRPEVELHLERR